MHRHRQILALVVAIVAASSSVMAQTEDATPQRPSFTTDTSTTAPGTLELEFGGTFSAQSWHLPTSLKFTPDTDRRVFSRLELGVSFDALTDRAEPNDGPGFSETIGLSARRAVYSTPAFAVAVSPELLLFPGGERSGVSAGGTLIGAWSADRLSAVVNLRYTRASSPGTDNPANTVEISTDAGCTLGRHGIWSKLSVFGGALYARDSLTPGDFSLEQGLAYRVRRNWVFDVAVRQTGLRSKPISFEMLFGFTANLGRPANW